MDTNWPVPKKKNESPIVVQSNDFAKGSTNDLVLNQLRILYFLISCIRKDDEVLYPIEVSYLSLGKIISADGKVSHGRKQYLEELLLEFQNRALYMVEDTKFTVFPWFSYFTPDLDTNNGKVVFQFNEHLKDYFLQQKRNFAQYELGYVLSFKNANTVRLYNLFVGYAYRGSLKISFDQLRRQLNFLNEKRGIDKYNTFKIFSSKVLGPAIEEINEKGDVEVSYSIIKDPDDARKVWGVEFTFDRKAALTPARTVHPVASVLEKREDVPGGIVRKVEIQ